MPPFNSFRNRFVQFPSSIQTIDQLKVHHKLCVLCFSTAHLGTGADEGLEILTGNFNFTKLGFSSLVLGRRVIKDIQCACGALPSQNSIASQCTLPSSETFFSMKYVVKTRSFIQNITAHMYWKSTALSSCIVAFLIPGHCGLHVIARKMIMLLPLFETAVMLCSFSIPTVSTNNLCRGKFKHEASANCICTVFSMLRITKLFEI